MSIKLITDKDKNAFDRLTFHPLQSWAWGEFREKLGQKVIRLGEFDGDKLISVCQFSIHKTPLNPLRPLLPFIPDRIAYCPRSSALSPDMLAEIKKIAKENKCIFVKFEPNVLLSDSSTPPKSPKFPQLPGLRPGKSLFTSYTFQLDLTQSAEELLKNMRPKTRYNINLARKKGVVVEEDNSDAAFEVFQKLTAETTKRQKFFAHAPRYRKLMWQTMRDSGIARLLIAKLPSAAPKSPLFLSAWILFFWNGAAYYPYGASFSVHRELMASNLLAWEALILAKKNGCQKFDFWGALGPNPDKNDPWYGFHRFKEGYGGRLVEFIGTYDLVINPFLYKLYNLADRLRWFLLRHI